MSILVLSLYHLLENIEEDDNKFWRIIYLVLGSLVLADSIFLFLMIGYPRLDNASTHVITAIAFSYILTALASFALVLFGFLLVKFFIALHYVLKNNKDRRALEKALKDIDEEYKNERVDKAGRKLLTILKYKATQEDIEGIKGWTAYENIYYKNELLAQCQVLFNSYQILNKCTLEKLVEALNYLYLYDYAIEVQKFLEEKFD